MADRIIGVTLWCLLGAAFVLPYVGFLGDVIRVWNSADYSYGIFIPVIAAYLIWQRRKRFVTIDRQRWNAGLCIVVAGCVLQLVASRSGSLLLSGVALILSLLGTVGYLWGKQYMRIVAIPLAFLILMVPLPSYVTGGVTWNLQVAASTISSSLLSSLGVPVYQDGNLIRLPNYTLEVEEACSGSRSICALLATALVLAMNLEKKWLIRIAFIAAAPVLAIATNVIRIGGTGLLAWRFGAIAANESLHSVWGILLFMAATGALVAVQRILQWATIEHA